MMSNHKPLLLSITAVFLLLLRSVSAVDDNNLSDSNSTDYIRSSCNATLYPEVCFSSLSRYASNVQKNPQRLARVAVGVSLSRARHLAAYLSNLSRNADYGSDTRASSALHDCFSNLGDAVDEIHDSLKQLREISSAASAESFRFLMSNVQTWMSAALTDEETCTDGFEDVPDGEVKADVSEKAADVKKFTSNALALVNSYANHGMSSQEIEFSNP